MDFQPQTKKCLVLVGLPHQTNLVIVEFSHLVELRLLPLQIMTMMLFHLKVLVPLIQIDFLLEHLLVWHQISLKCLLVVVQTSQTTLIRLYFLMPYLFNLKIVFRSTNQALVPAITALRAIALSA